MEHDKNQLMEDKMNDILIDNLDELSNVIPGSTESKEMISDIKAVYSLKRDLAKLKSEAEFKLKELDVNKDIREQELKAEKRGRLAGVIQGVLTGMVTGGLALAGIIITTLYNKTRDEANRDFDDYWNVQYMEFEKDNVHTSKTWAEQRRRHENRK